MGAIAGHKDNMVYNKNYKISGMDFQVKIGISDNMKIMAIQVCDDDKYQNVYPNDKLYQDIKEAFLLDLAEEGG